MHDSPERAAEWEAEGRRLSPALDGIAAAVVAGPDVVAASHLALGLASGQSSRRRVALGDLTGAAAPLQRLVADQVTDEDPHGIADVLLYGASPNHVARQVDAEGRLFVLPVGTEALGGDELADPRWSRIAGGFRDVGALLLLVAPTSTPQLDALARQLDGTIAADDGATAQLMPNVLATAQRLDATPTGTRATTPLRPTEQLRQRVREREAEAGAAAAAAGPARRIHPALLVGAGLVLIAALVWAGLTIGRGTRGQPVVREAGGVSSPADSLGGPASASTTPAPAGDSTALAAATAAPDSAAAAAPLAPPPVSNPADSARAVAFAIELFSADGEDAARQSYTLRPRTLLATTLTPVAGPDGALSYRVAGGAYRTRRQVERELARLRGMGALGATQGAIVRLPYAVQIESGVPRDSLRVVMNRFVAMRLAPYAMEQPNRSSQIYVGAFAEPGEARALLATLQAANIPAALVVRTGKPL